MESTYSTCNTIAKTVGSGFGFPVGQDNEMVSLPKTPKGSPSNIGILSFFDHMIIHVQIF